MKAFLSPDIDAGSREKRPAVPDRIIDELLDVVSRFDALGGEL
ncbi:hypothetical protein [Methylobacter sp. BlB1]|nr:hypothetical protein [Methylobacter sp. BlB1]